MASWITPVRPRLRELTGYPVKRNGNTRPGRERQRASGGVTMTAVQLTMLGTRAMRVERRTQWVRNLRTLSVFTKWWAMCGSGQRIVMLKATPMHQRMGAQTKRQRTASAWTAAVVGCTQRGSSVQPPGREILPTTAMQLWGSAWRRRSKAKRALHL